MSLSSFEYVEPGSLEEACAFLAEVGNQARAIAGGTDLLVQMKRRVRNPQFVLALKSIPGLDYIVLEGNALRIGALATLMSVESSSVVRKHFPMLAHAAHCVGSVQIRNIGTLAGNLCHASPSADTAPSLFCLSARIKIVSGSGGRLVDTEDFFLGPGKTVVEAGELVQEVQIPLPAPSSAGTYIKHSIRRSMDLALVGVATFFSLRQGRVAGLRIALGAVAPTPFRAKRAEAVLEGSTPSDEVIGLAARTAAEEASPISDIRSSAEYRRKMIEVNTARALKQTLLSLDQLA